MSKLKIYKYKKNKLIKKQVKQIYSTTQYLKHSRKKYITYTTKTFKQCG